jgi:hypothetical protein
MTGSAARVKLIVEIGFALRAETFLSGLLEGRGMAIAGIVDQHVEPTKAFQCKGDSFLRRGRICNVQAKGAHYSAAAANAAPAAAKPTPPDAAPKIIARSPCGATISLDGHPVGGIAAMKSFFTLTDAGNQRSSICHCIFR